MPTCDFGQAKAVIGGVEQTVHYFVGLPHRRVLVNGLPARDDRGVLRRSRLGASTFLGGVPRSILYDNTTLAVARETAGASVPVCSRSSSHYLFGRFGRPGKGNDKGKVEGLVGYERWSRLSEQRCPV